MSPGTLRVLNLSGDSIESPREWAPAFVEVMLGETSEWQAATVRLNDTELPLSLRRIGGTTRVVAEWPRAGPGKYRLRLTTASTTSDRVVEIQPSKLTKSQFALLIHELETSLPLSIALGVQQLGGLAGVTLVPPREVTLATELHRLRIAVEGDGRTRGLVEILRGVSSDPHQMLRSTGLWVRREHARRPDPNRAHHALLRPANAESGRKLVEVCDGRVEHSFDTYENRLVRSFLTQVERRLSRLTLYADRDEDVSVPRAVRALLEVVRRSKRAAAFLEEVPDLAAPPDRVSMVLLRRPYYRAALEAFLRFQRGQSVRIDDRAMDAPLEQLPYLYQLWCTLGVIQALLAVANERGYRVVSERLIGRDSAGLFLRPLPDGKPAVTLVHDASGTRVQLIPERTYAPNASGLHSLSFTQRPDIGIEASRPNAATAIWLFDPKYKLDGEIGAGATNTSPLKVDIDKMHAYRDAIRDGDGVRAVRYAAILYPGQTCVFPDGIEAISAVPPSDQWNSRVKVTLQSALAGLI
jgi:hypothetical protein